MFAPENEAIRVLIRIAQDLRFLKEPQILGYFIGGNQRKSENQAIKDSEEPKKEKRSIFVGISNQESSC